MSGKKIETAIHKLVEAGAAKEAAQGKKKRSRNKSQKKAPNAPTANQAAAVVKAVVAAEKSGGVVATGGGSNHGSKPSSAPMVPIGGGAEALAAGICFPGTLGILAGSIAQTEPGNAVPVKFAIDLPVVQQLADTGTYFGPNAGDNFVILRPDPLNFMIYASPIASDFDLLAYSISESLGDQMASQFTVYAGEDNRLCVVGGDYKLQPEVSRFYAMVAPNGEKLVWLDPGTLVVTFAGTIPTLTSVTGGVTLGRWNGSEVAGYGSFQTPPSVTLLDTPMTGKGKYKAPGSSRVEPLVCAASEPLTFTKEDVMKKPKRFTQLDWLTRADQDDTKIALQKKLMASTGRMGVAISKSFNVTIFSAGYYSINLFVDVFQQSGTFGNIVAQTGSPIDFTFSVQHVVSTSIVQSCLVHKPIPDIEKQFALWNNVSISALGFVLTNISALLGRGGAVATAQVPRAADWQSFLFGGKKNPYWWGGYFNPYDLVNQVNPLIRWTGDGAKGASGHMRPDRDSLVPWKCWGNGETNYDDHLDNQILTTFSPMLAHGPSLIVAYTTAAGVAGVQPQTYKFEAGASLFYTTSAVLTPTTTMFFSEAVIMKALQSVLAVDQFGDNPDHVTNIANALISLFKNGRRVNKELRTTVKEVSPALYRMMAGLLD